MLVDSHAHLTSLKEGEIESVLQRATLAGIGAIVNIATTREELERGMELSKRFPHVYQAAATTPHDVEKLGEKEFSFFQENQRSLIAIGETGLDYHYEHSPSELQKRFLRRYIALAKEANLPLIFHCREAFEDLFKIVDEEGGVTKAILHCFTGNEREAREVVERGWALSLSGIVTFKKSETLRNVAREIPLASLLLETDTPYLAPQSKRGKPNEPSYLVEIAKVIAEVRKMSFDELCQATSHNAKCYFKF